MSGISQIIQSLGPVRLAIIGAVMLGVVGFFGYLMSQTSQGNQALLFAQLDPADASRVVHKIETLDIPVNIGADGTSIYVPSDKVARLRMELAQDGLPGGGGIGYEIFDRGDVLSTSGNLVDINRLRALEGELAKSIRTISGVASTRVHLVIPKRELFSREKAEPSASIVLKMKSPGKLGESQVRAIQHLVASAVPGLSTERVSIVDDKGNLLAKSQETDGVLQGLNSRQETKRSYELNTSKQLESLIEKAVGMGKVRVETSADIDFSEATINTEKYDPEGQVVRSTVNTLENGSTESAEGAVSVQNAVPQEQGPGGGKNINSNKRNEENVNYEISRVVETQKKESGSIKSLSVAVLVDGTTTKGKDGKAVYTPRPKEALEQIKVLVKTAIGFKEDRGDKVEVVNMPFAQLEGEEAPVEPAKSMMPEMDLTKIIELVVLAVVGILILMMIVRPVLLRVIESSGIAESDPQAAGLLAAAGGYSMGAIPDYSAAGALTSSFGSPIPPVLPGNYGGSAEDPVEDESKEELLLDIAAIDGRVRASTLKRISDVIDKHPEEAVTIIRNWMYDESWK